MSQSSPIMEADVTTRARIAALSEELDDIHRWNAVYWRRKDCTREARAEYHWRLERLDEIRSDLALLKQWKCGVDKRAFGFAQRRMSPRS
jgi:hypothetical protein